MHQFTFMRSLQFWIIYLVFSIVPLVAQQVLPVEPSFESGGDWLLSQSEYKAGLYQGESSDIIVLSNGLVRRAFLIRENIACIALDNVPSGTSMLRGVKPEAEISIDGRNYDVGGMSGQPNYAYLNPDWLDSLHNDEMALQFVNYEIGEIQQSFHWARVRHHHKDAAWPPKGLHLQLNFSMPASSEHEDISVAVHYELYDNIPVIGKWITVKNKSDVTIQIDKFTSEIIAAVEYISPVENRGVAIPTPNIHVETDYAFAGMTTQNSNRHVIHWEEDPDYHTQVNYLKTTPCLLKVKPELGPNQSVASGETFTSFKTFVLVFDGYDRERNGLAQRRMYKTIAPWTTENPLMMHARFADWERVKIAIDQAAAVGFEMVILTFGSGFNIEDDSADYLKKMQSYADYAKGKGVEIGGYSLLASRKVGGGNDVVMPEGQKPTFGNSPCLVSEWGNEYFEKLYRFYENSGFSLLEHDGSYPGDICTAHNHPGHTGLDDSRWNQFQVISKFYKWCRSRGIYLNVPDYYYLAGSNKCAMGYREVNWSLPREQQVIHTRQNIYDGTWTKGTSMGWMFVPLTEYHGGGEAATIEPLSEHLDHYEQMMINNLGAGVQACYRGPRLYDNEATKQKVIEQISWYKEHREVLEGEIIHLRRADGRDLDYWLNVNPKGEEKGMLMVFNPLDKSITKRISIPLYYTGLSDKTWVSINGQEKEELQIGRDYTITLELSVPAQKHTWVLFE